MHGRQMSSGVSDDRVIYIGSMKTDVNLNRAKRNSKQIKLDTKPDDRLL